MAAPQYWLNHKLFADLPKADSVALQKKIRQMVDLMAALAMKIFQLGESHSEAFFKKLMKSYEASQNTPYKIWKSRQLRLTMKKYKQYQAELTADILNLGIMDHDDEPTDEERAAVRLDLLKMEMSHGKKLSDNFIDAAAKLRRYSYWDGHKFMIDYPIAKQYLYRIFDKLTNDQRIALYYYNVQMIQLHQDMDELHQEEPSASTYMPSSESQEDRIRSFFNKQDDRTQQAWLREAMKANRSYWESHFLAETTLDGRLSGVKRQAGHALFSKGICRLRPKDYAPELSGESENRSDHDDELLQACYRGQAVF